MQHCGTHLTESTFDPTDPTGEYELDMVEPRSKAIMVTLMQLILQSKGEFVPGTTFHKTDQGTQRLDLTLENIESWRVPDTGVFSFKFGLTLLKTKKVIGV